MAVIRSHNGVHRINGLDVKGWHGFIVLPGSVHAETGRQYVFLPGRELEALHVLPPFDPAWVRDIRTEPELQRFAAISGQGPGPIRDIDAYIHGIVSIQGQNGSNAMMTVCYRLIDAGHTFAEALAKLRRWNEACAFPPWPDKELVRGLTSAFQRKSAQPWSDTHNPPSSLEASDQ